MPIEHRGLKPLITPLRSLVMAGVIMITAAACDDGASIADEGSSHQAAEGASAPDTSSSPAPAGPELLSITSDLDFEETLALVQRAIETRGFKTFAVIDHAAGAASVDQTLRPTTLIIFGNPKGGTPVLQSAQSMGIVLPLKMLVFKDEQGSVRIAWPDMAAAFARHGVTGQEAILGKMQTALEAIAVDAGDDSGS